MDLVVAAGALILGIIAGFLIKPSTFTTTTTTTTVTTISTTLTTITTTYTSTSTTITITSTKTTISYITSLVRSYITTLYSTTITYLVTSTVTTLSTVTSYIISTIYRTMTFVSTSIYTTTLTLFKTVTNTVIATLMSVVSTTTSYVTKTETVTVYPQEVPKATLPYLGTSLLKMYSLLNDLKKTYEGLSSKSNPIVEQFRKAMQKRFKLVAEILNLQNDLNLIVRYYKDLIDSDKALASLTKQRLSYNNIYKGYMYLLKMKVDMAMIDSALSKLGDKIDSLYSQMPSSDYFYIRYQLGMGIGIYLKEVSKPMNLKQALPLLMKAKKVGGPEKIVDAYISLTIVRLDYYYRALLGDWEKAKNFYEGEYQKYYEIFSSIPG